MSYTLVVNNNCTTVMVNRLTIEQVEKQYVIIGIMQRTETTSKIHCLDLSFCLICVNVVLN